MFRHRAHQKAKENSEQLDVIAGDSKEQRKLHEIVSLEKYRHPAEEIDLLIVDDELPIINALKRLFLSDIYHIRAARNGNDAFKYIVQKKPDVIICDIRMPSMHGDVFLSKVRAIDEDIPCIVISAYSDSNTIINLINTSNIKGYLTKPWDDNELKLHVYRAALQHYLKRNSRHKTLQLFELNKHLDSTIKERSYVIESINKILEEQEGLLNQNFENSVNMLSFIANILIPKQQSHSNHVAKTAKQYSQYLGLPDKQVKEIEAAALLHDIGLLSLSMDKQYISDIELTDQQKLKFKEHPLIGESIIKCMPELKIVAELVRFHHENHDGSGFPDGLAKEDIPLGSRIIAICDTHSDLFYKLKDDEDFENKKILNEMRPYKNIKFEPRLLKSFSSMWSQKKNFGSDKQAQLVKTLHSGELRSGMVLYKDILTNDGQKLLSKEHSLTDIAIKSIKTKEKIDEKSYTIYVYSSDSL